MTSLPWSDIFAGGNHSTHARSTLVQTFVVVACFELAQFQICLGGHCTDQRGRLPLRAAEALHRKTDASQKNSRWLITLSSVATCRGNTLSIAP